LVVKDLLVISDLNKIWFRRGNEEDVWDEKQRFNAAIEINNIDGILELLKEFISEPNKEATYRFQEFDDGNLTFEINAKIEIYLFKWKFDLVQVDQTQQMEMIAEELVNPLLLTVKSMETRVNMLKKAIGDLEMDLLKRMTEKEKSTFKSKVDDSERQWRFMAIDQVKRLHQARFEIFFLA
jgi:hypothetical protein